MDFTLIPFGLSEEDGRFLDVAEVPRGKRCGCICPSCKTPLIARHGNINEWHFAHASRTVYLKTETECEFSFYVSVRLMARQIVDDTLSMAFPAYTDCVSAYLSRYDHYISVPFTVAEQQNISLTNIEIEKNFLGASVDIFAHVGDFSFIIYFTHPGREIPNEFSNPADSKCGIVSLSLEQAPNLFREAQDSKSTYREILYDFLVNDIASKKWIFHPRYKHCEQAAQKSLKQKTNHMLEHFHSNQNKSRPVRRGNKKRGRLSHPAPILKGTIDIPTIEIPRRRAEFECVICHSVWQDWEPSDSECPKCNTHLYRTVKGYLDNE